MSGFPKEGEKATDGLENASVEKERLKFEPMLIKDLHEVYYIEQSVFSYHWTYRNFLSSVASEDWGQVLRNEAGDVVGYFIAMEMVDEMHLLKIAVAGQYHGRGYGRLLMDRAVVVAREAGMASMLLEVRPTNEAAVGLYEKTGFKTIGVRKGYYVDTREDALVMRLEL